MYIRTGMVGKAHCGEQAGKVWIPIDVVLAVAKWWTLVISSTAWKDLRKSLLRGPRRER
jgi:hypothetical protein